METIGFTHGGGTIEGVRWEPVGPTPPRAEAGPTGGLPLLLVHGLAGSTIEWEPVGPVLADAAGAPVVAVDLPGFGRSRLSRGSSGVAAHTRAVGAVLEQIGPAVVVGNSMGGLVALHAAARHPERARALVLVDPALITGSGGGGAPGASRGRTAARYAIAVAPVVGPAVISARRRRAGAERYVDERLAVVVHDPGRVPALVRDRLVAQASERAAYRESSRCYAASARSILTGARVAWRAVGTVDAPTLVLHGAHDRLVPVGLVDRLRTARPDWHYEVYDDAGHQPHLEVPERFVASLVTWLGAQVER